MCSVHGGVRYAVWLGGKQSGKRAVSQLSTETEGEGWPARRLQICHSSLSSLFALQWFSHQTRLLNQRPPSTKTANYVQMRYPPPCPFRVPSRVLSFSTLFYLTSTHFFPALATYFSRSQSNGKTLCYIFDLLLVSVHLSLGPSEE